MKEEPINTPNEYIFSSGYNSSEEQEENNFNSPEAFPENIFANQYKENSEQLSSKILAFPFTLDTYELVNLKSKEELLSYGDELTIIFGNLEKIKNNELFLKLTFISKDKTTLLNLKDYKNEIRSLINLDLDFIAIFQNQLFIKYENENLTNEAYVSLQKSSTLLDLLYDEENSLNIYEDNTEKKNNNKINDDKKEETKNKYNADNKYLNNENKILLSNSNKINNYIENINSNINVKKNIFPLNQNNKILKEQQQKQIPINPIIFSPQLYTPFIFPINNFPKNPPINPGLMAQIPKPNPFFIQSAIALQNYMKFQQQQLIKNNNIINNIIVNNERKELLNNIKNITQINNNNNIKININSNINKNNNHLSPLNNQESSTNSNTSSSSSKGSSPNVNYQPKVIKNFKIENNNNIINNNININNNNINNNNINNNNINNNNINNYNINNNNINNNNINNNNINNNKIFINNNISKNVDYNLEEIVQNKQYKEYIPKNIKEKEKELKFQTNSTRDYQYKYVSRYIVQIENEKNFPVTKMIIGNNGMLLRNILYDNCIKYGDHTTKIRLRGKGSGYKEGPKKEESKDPMELCISSLNMISFSKCSAAIENLLLQIYYKYYSYQCKNYMEKKKIDNFNNNNKLGNTLINMKKILKYHYVVNRYNTLVKEEKRRKKEEELNKGNINKNDIDN